MTLVTPIPIPEPRPELASQRMSFRGYGLGFNLHDYRGRKVVNHTGGLPGSSRSSRSCPSSSSESSCSRTRSRGDAFNAITYHVLDHYLGGPTTDWVEAYRKVQTPPGREDRRSRDEDVGLPRCRVPSFASSRRLRRAYRDRWYGSDRGRARRRAARPSIHPHSVARGRPRALAARHLRRAVARSRASRGRVSHLRPRPRRPGGAGEDAGGLSRHRLQLRLPRPGSVTRTGGSVSFLLSAALQIQLGSVQGKVMDPSGGAIRGARVVVVDADRERSDRERRYRSFPVPRPALRSVSPPDRRRRLPHA